MTSRRFRPSPDPSAPSYSPCTCTSCKVFTCVNCVNVLRGPPSELSSMVRPFLAQFATPKGTTDLIKSHGSGPMPIYSRCLFNCPPMKEVTSLFPLRQPVIRFQCLLCERFAVRETDLFVSKRIFCFTTTRSTVYLHDNLQVTCTNL